MHAEVIAFGDELTSGLRLDTNSQWLSQRLGEIGIPTRFHTTVSDDLAASIDAFRNASKRADVIVSTGGLGPTADDLTRQAIADAFAMPLELNETSLQHVRSLFESRGRDMPERNRIQAMFPRGSCVVVNPHGTAPGIDLTVQRQNGTLSRIVALPGVPAEMKQMWEESVRPAFVQHAGDNLRVLCHHRLKCFGIGESALEEKLPDLIRRGRDPSVGITVSKATITLRITAAGPSEEACQIQMRPTIETIRQCLGELIFGAEDDELQHAITRLLQDRGETLAVCEWGSGGMVAEWLRAVDTSHIVFPGGIVVSDAAAAKRLLGVDQSLEPHEHAMALASSVRERLETDYGLALGAFPDAMQSSRDKFFVGLATRAQTTVAGRRYAGHPDILKTRAAKQALDLLRLHLLKLGT